ALADAVGRAGGRVVARVEERDREFQGQRVGGSVGLLDGRHHVRALADGGVEHLEDHLAAVGAHRLVRRRRARGPEAGSELVLLGDDGPRRELGCAHWAFPRDSTDFMIAASAWLLSSSGTKPTPITPLPGSICATTTRSGPVFGPRTPALSSC